MPRWADLPGRTAVPDLRLAVSGSFTPGTKIALYGLHRHPREIISWERKVQHRVRVEARNALVMGRRPTHHENDMTLDNGMLIAGIKQGVDVSALAHCMLEAHWRYDAGLADAKTRARIGANAGLDPAPLLDAALSPETQAVYEANTEEAIRRSAFGSPSHTSLRPLCSRTVSAH